MPVTECVAWLAQVTDRPFVDSPLVVSPLVVSPLVVSSSSKSFDYP